MEESFQEGTEAEMIKHWWKENIFWRGKWSLVPLGYTTEPLQGETSYGKYFKRGRSEWLDPSAPGSVFCLRNTENFFPLPSPDLEDLCPTARTLSSVSLMSLTNTWIWGEWIPSLVLWENSPTMKWLTRSAHDCEVLKGRSCHQSYCDPMGQG